ncbi:hypothetical protein VN23_02125 [Janthinobacterium sp. B9-8]|nr:hypothetical protein VN23_02125 [Janthinobacterium sp. B9-8]
MELNLGAKFNGGFLDDCNLSGGVFKNAIFEGVCLFRSDFSNADLTQAEFYLCMALGANFSGAVLNNAKFIGGGFEQVCFANADLRSASFLKDNMGGEVILYGADFTSTVLDEVTFDGCLYDATTIFPVGFSPEVHGLLKINN